MLMVEGMDDIKVHFCGLIRWTPFLLLLLSAIVVVLPSEWRDKRVVATGRKEKDAELVSILLATSTRVELLYNV